MVLMFEDMVSDRDTVAGNNILASLRSSQPNSWHALVSSPGSTQALVLSSSLFG